MSIAQVHAIAPVALNTTIVGGITRSAVQLGATVIQQNESGEIYPTYSTINSIKQGASFTSRDLTTVLTYTGVAGVALSGAGAIFYFRKRDSVGPTGSGTHNSYTAASGIVVPTSLSVSHQGNAEVSCAVAPISSDGATTAISVATNASLPSVVSATLDDQWTLYSASINGTAVAGETSIEVDFGSRVETYGADSDILDTVACVTSVAPTVTMRGINLAWVQNTSSVCDILGESVVHATTNFILKKRGVAIDGAGEHIKVTLNGVVYADMVEGSATDPANCALVFRCNSPDGSTAPLVLDLAYTAAP